MVSVANKYHQELQETAAYVAAKGILAADESTGTIAKRFESIAVENTEENRRAYRELLFTSPNIGEYISGAILFEETLGQKTASGEPFVDLLKRTGIMIGIKVDKGVVPIHGTVGETATQGLDGLGARCAEYYKKGCRFAKWRAVINVSDSAPSELGIAENAHGLARYAAICQENGLVPIVEPEVLMDGPHDIERAASVTEHVLAIVFRALHEHHVLLEGILLKPNMVLPGSENPNKRNVSPQTVAEFTVRVLGRTVPPVVPGIMFLSGGQSEEEATLNLDAMNKLDAKRPWSLSFSYGRALQSSCLKAWKGQSANFEAAQQAFLVRAKANHEAHLGVYGGGAGGGSASESLHVKNYTY